MPTNTEPPKPPVGEPIKNCQDWTFEPPKMGSGEPKKSVVDITKKEDWTKAPVVKKLSENADDHHDADDRYHQRLDR
ncbi:hypothetical protein VTI74DRAFT_4665 [Chaetomium olivicolor]